MGNNHRASTVYVLDADRARSAELSQRLGYLNYEPRVVDVAQCGFEPAAAAVAVLVGDTDEKAAAALKTLANSCPELPMLLVSDAASADEFDCPERPTWRVSYPLKRAEILKLLKRAERYAGIERRRRITGSSSSIREVRALIEQVASFDTNVLVTGESGTGKELVARTVHGLSDRRHAPFVPINCGAIPPELLESELFGHKKGAFTGAISDRKGRFELAEGGTLFLDEIGDMPKPMQVKLLRVLQERCFERVGSNTTQPCNVRIIAATHRDLKAAVQAEDFREDLFYRLNVFPIEMPPLKKRASDLPDLLEELLIQHGPDEAGAERLRVSPQALRALAAYDWPGNIRELSNLVERLAILKPSGTIELEDLPEKYRSAASRNASPAVASGNTAPADLKAHLQAVERDLISQAMEASGGVVAKAARLLSLRRTTLVEKLAKYQLH